MTRGLDTNKYERSNHTKKGNKEMARVLKWKEKLVLALVSVFLSVTTAWPAGKRDADSGQRSHSRLLTTGSKTTLGIELMARKPYVRLTRIARTSVALPFTAGAYVAMAEAQVSD